MLVKRYLKFISCIYLFFVVSVHTNAQTSDSIDTSSTKRAEACTATRVEISYDKLRTNWFHVSEVLTSLAGVNQLNTGIGISKPVLRGLYGNRIQTVLFGLRFDNQQWGYNHGLGLPGMGISEINVTYGPSALLHGSEAMGGVIRITEERKEEKPGRISGDLNTRFSSNTLGNSTDIGFKGNSGKRNWGVRGGYESQADYMDGKNRRILNSRFNGYYFKSNFGFKKDKWESQNNYYSSLNNFGLILVTDSLFKKKTDERFSRTMDGAHQKIFVNILSSQNNLKLKNSQLKLNIGGLSNIHKEYMGYGSMRFNMHLISAVYNLQWIKSLSKKTELIVGNQGLFQRNVNRGTDIVVPDARTVENGLSAILNYRLEHLSVEGGLSGNYRFIKTFLNPNFNTKGSEIRPFEKSFPSINGMIAVTYNVLKKFALKLKSSTGFRSPNLAELSYIGIQAGTFHFEEGNVNLKTEQNFNSEMGLIYTSDQLYFSIAAYANYFRNYIYTAPTSKTYGGDPVYSYFQSPAKLYGGEVLLRYNPLFVKNLYFQSDYSTVTGSQKNGTALPLVPANKLHTELVYTVPYLPFFRSTIFMISHDYVFRQDHTTVFETPTDSYMLFNVAIGSTLLVKEQHILITIACNNILNQYYYDHLSMIKNWGYHNIGRNIVLSMQIPFYLKK